MKNIIKVKRKWFGRGSACILAFLIVAAGAIGTFSTMKVSANDPLTAEPSETAKLEDVQFSYAYDVQRSPAYPKKGDLIRAYGLSTPYVTSGSRLETSEGTWTLINRGTYAGIKGTYADSDNLASLVTDCVSRYDGLSEDSIVIHELKNGSIHIAYGVAVAYDSEKGCVVYLGDALYSGAGYLLSVREQSDEVEIYANLDITDWVAPEPSETVKPVESEAPVVSEEPVVSEAPVESVKPSETVKPVESVKPSEPVVEKPSIAVQPKAASSKVGEKAVFTVEAVGTDLAYQWQIDRNDGSGFVNITGADSASYTTSAVEKICNGYKYQCVVSNSAGSVTSDVVILTVADGAEVKPSAAPEVQTSNTPNSDSGKNETVTAAPTATPTAAPAATTEPAPKTGDANYAGLWISVLCAGAVCVAGVMSDRKKNREF